MLSTLDVKQLAYDAGFDLCGVTTPEVVPEAQERFHRWLDRGYHGEMAYLANEPERRTNPRALAENVRSIVMLGLNYYQPNSPQTPAGHGAVSRYARGRDYHKIAESRLKRLERAIRRHAGDEPMLRWYVDYGPFLERTYAARAGLGFLGKNSMLINGKFGSWIFLSEMITSLDLASDDQFAVNHGSCGTCKRCMTYCPTGAIVNPGVIDATKCISYLTIERPGEIPATLAAEMGENVFGCDVCQEVCPYNVKSVLTTHPEFLPDHGVGEFLNLRELLKLQSREDFLKLTSGTPLTRPKMEGLQRNARIVLENEKRLAHKPPAKKPKKTS